MPTFRIKEAADLLGVSDDTVRRWADGGRIETTTDDSGRQAIDGAMLARFAEELAHDAAHLADAGPGGGVGPQPVQRPGHPGRARTR